MFYYINFEKNRNMQILIVHAWNDPPVDNFGTVVGENPDCLLLSGTVVGENPDHVCWAHLFCLFFLTSHEWSFGQNFVLVVQPKDLDVKIYCVGLF